MLADLLSRPFEHLGASIARESDRTLWEDGIVECQIQSLKLVVALELVLAWLLAIPWLIDLVPSGIGWTALWLVLGVVASWVILRVRASYSLAAVGVIGSMFLATVAATQAIGLGPVACWFVVIVEVSGVLLGPLAAGGTAALASLALLDADRPADPAANGFTSMIVVLIWIVAFVTWLGLRPLQRSLDWATSSYADARARAAEAERHRGELGRVVKSLSETHERLERLTVELDRARQLAENARALKARFAAYISHELRTPLNLIIGFSEMLLMAPDSYGGEVLPPAYRGDVNSIYQSARHLSTLIDDVLDLSQIDAHRMALERDDVAVAEIVREAVDTVEAAFAEKGLAIELDVPPRLPSLYVDRTRIRQVLINLLGNALRYTDHGGVTVRAAAQSGEIVVSVVDTGSGIPPAQLPRLFEDFRQAEQPDDQHQDGSGLGLAIARRFIALHGGWIRAESGPDRGTTVLFGLPVDRDAAPLDGTAGWETLERSVVVASSLPRIGVVSDDPWLTRLAQRYLDGYRVVPLKDSGSHDLGRPQRPDVSALLAATPSDLEGWSRLEQTIAGGDRLPVICCSLRGGREAIDRLGVQDYLDKPITRERLAEVLARWRPGRKPRTVLVVDDNHEVVRLLSRMVHLISRRFRVSRAYGGGEALAMMRQSPPDLLLLDLLMPEVNGYDVLEAMRQDANLKDVPVVIISAKGMEDDAVVAGMFGLARADGFHAGEFMRCLQSTLDSLLPSAQAVATTPDSA